MSKKEKTGNRKTLLAVLLLLIAFAIIIGSIFAFFSDYVSSTVSGTGGTLDLTIDDENGNDTTTIKVNGNTILGKSIPNLNPGDIVEISYSVTNEGNKSAYLRNLVSLGIGTNHAGAQPSTSGMFKLYQSTTSNPISLSDIRNNTTAAQNGLLTSSTITGFSYTESSPYSIINGGSSVIGKDEVETSGINGPVAVSYILYFDPSAGNEYQEVSLNYIIKTEALQYRNNTSPNWTQVTSSTFKLGE